MGVEAGMRAMLARRAAELDAGAVPVGWKIGINVEAVQARLGIDAPVAGYLTSRTVIGTDEPVEVSEWTAPMLEPEVAIRVGEDGGIAALAPAIELVDVDLPFEDIEAILAGNVFHRGVRFGDERASLPVDRVSCRVTRGGAEAAAAEDDFDPAAVVRHVAEFLAAHGARLEPGERVIAGSLTSPIPVSGGERFEVDLGEIGSVGVSSKPG